jgi:hypothetical protein
MVKTVLRCPEPQTVEIESVNFKMWASIISPLPTVQYLVEVRNVKRQNVNQQNAEQQNAEQQNAEQQNVEKQNVELQNVK